MTTTQEPKRSNSVEEMDELRHRARRYIESMENVCKKQEEMASRKFQKELELLDSKKKKVNELIETLEKTRNVAVHYDDQIVGFKQETELLSDEVIDHMRRNIQRKVLTDAIKEMNDCLTIPEEVIHGIIHGKVTDELFVRNLDVLNKHIWENTRGTERSKGHPDYPQCHFICVMLERLKSTALNKIAKYVKEHSLKFHLLITKCKLPSDLKIFHKHYKFLRSNDPKTAQEVIDSYIKDKSDIYITYFKLLDDQVAKLCDEIKFAETEEKNRIYMGTDMGTNEDEDEVINRFIIGDRIKVLDNITESDVTNKTKFYFEDVFKNYHIRLVDMLYQENAFLHSYFQADQPERMEVLGKMMARTVTFLNYSWKKYLGTMYDSITSFLCFHLVLRIKQFCSENGINMLDKYWETLERLLLYRFSHTVHMNVHSLTEYDPSKYEFDFCSHYAVKRYAPYAAELSKVHKVFRHPVIQDLLDQLRNAVDELCERVAGRIQDKTHQMVFLINCYQQIIDAAAERFGDEFVKDVQYYIKKLPDLAAGYVDELIKSYYGEMVRYLDQMEVHVATEDYDKVAKYAPMAEGIIDDFNNNWEQDLKEIHTKVLMSFMNFITANGILEATLVAYSTLILRFAAVLIGPMRRRLVSTLDVQMGLQKQRLKF